jgi:hypothetical protein
VKRLHLHFLTILCIGFSSCATDKEKFMISVHAQGSDMESPRSNIPDLIGTPPRKIILKRSPEFTHKNIAAFHSFPADNGDGNGITMRLDFSGSQALELVTRLRSGEILRSVVNGRGVDYVLIDRPIADGLFTIWQGVPDEVVTEMAKKYPPIKGLRSASSQFDMTPSTKAEKKKSMKLFRREKEATDPPDLDDSPYDGPRPNTPQLLNRTSSATIQAPAPPPAADTLPAIDPITPLPLDPF